MNRFNSGRGLSVTDYEMLASKGSVSGPYRARTLPSLAWVFNDNAPLPVWLRFKTRRELDKIEFYASVVEPRRDIFSMLARMFA